MKLNYVRRISAYVSTIYYSESVADPGFPVGGGVDLVQGAVDPRSGYVSKILHVKTKESGPVGGGARRARPPLDPPMRIYNNTTCSSDLLHTYCYITSVVLNLSTYPADSAQIYLQNQSWMSYDSLVNLICKYLDWHTFGFLLCLQVLRQLKGVKLVISNHSYYHKLCKVNLHIYF